MSSGKEGFGTPRGTYKIIQKDANYKSGTYGVLRSKSTGAVVNGDYNARAGGAPAGTYFDPAPMPYWMRITGGYGMHVGFVTGYPVSHGCVRLPADMAKTFFEHTPLGTKVTIREPFPAAPCSQGEKGPLPASLKRGFPLLPDGCPRYADAMAQLPHSGIDKRLRTSLNK